ncbi:MAG: hypothetical protein Q9217_003766 [Psora testacea]
MSTHNSDDVAQVYDLMLSTEHRANPPTNVYARRNALPGLTLEDAMSSTTTSTATPPRQAFEALLEDVKVSKAEFNHLIMDYLVSHGYPLAAQKFAAEANMQTVPDVDLITQRVEIREAIHSGDIQSAIERINELNPQLLDQDSALHFALLRLQLVELIRKATATDNGDITPALNFATTHLAPRAPTNPEFLADLERTMALLIFPAENLTPPLAEILQPSLRQEVAKRVNEALLRSNGERAKATLYDLISHRAWAHQKAQQMRKDSLPDHIDLGLDHTQNAGKSASQNGSMAREGSVDAMATSWDGQP